MEKEKEDRISSLPDCLLLEIISCLKLSTKEVIKTTSTISKRWQHLWTQLPTLLFIDKDDDVTEPNYYTDRDNYFSFINKTLTQCPTNLNLNKFELRIKKNRLHQPTPWIRHAITRNVQEVDLRIGKWRYGNPFILDDELFFNNSCLMSMKLSNCAFNPPNAAIRWDKLKFLCIEDVVLEGDLIGKILSGSPCLETLELDCYVNWRFSISLFGNFRVERLTCDTEAYKWFTNGDDTGSFDLGNMTMKLSRCVSNPPNGWDNLIFLRINFGKLDDDLIGKILSGSPCLETLELNYCYGVRRINIASKSVKNLVLSNYDNYRNVMDNYIDTVEINAPYILSLTIEETLSLVKILLLNVSFLVKADLRFRLSCGFASELGRDQGDIEDGLLQGLLSSLGHVNEVTFGDDCLQVLSRLKKRGFQFPKSSDVTLRGRYFLQPQIFVLIIILFFVFCVTMVSNLLAD